MSTPRYIAFLLCLLLFVFQTEALASPTNEPKKKITLNQFLVVNDYEFHDKRSFDHAIQSGIWHPTKSDPETYWCGDEDLDAARMNATVFHWAYVANGTGESNPNNDNLRKRYGGNEKALRMMGALGRNGFGELVISDNPNWWIPTAPKVGAVNMMSDVYMPRGVTTKEFQPNVFNEIIEGHGFHVSRGRLPGMIQRPVPEIPRAPMRPVRRPPLQLDRMTAEQFLSDWPRLPDDDSDIFESEIKRPESPDGETPKSPESEVKKPPKDDPGEGPAPKDPEKQPADPKKGGKEPPKETPVEKPAPNPEDFPNDPYNKGKGHLKDDFGDPREPPKGRPVSNDSVKPNNVPDTGSKTSQSANQNPNQPTKLQDTPHQQPNGPQPPSQNVNQPPQEPAKPPKSLEGGTPVTEGDVAPPPGNRQNARPEGLNHPVDQNPAHNVQQHQVQTNNIDNTVNNNVNNNNNYYGNQYNNNNMQDSNRVVDQNPSHQQQNSGGRRKKPKQPQNHVDPATQKTKLHDPGQPSTQDQFKPNTQDPVKPQLEDPKSPGEKGTNGQPAKSPTDSVNFPELDTEGQWEYPENNVAPESKNGQSATKGQPDTKERSGTEIEQPAKNGQLIDGVQPPAPQEPSKIDNTQNAADIAHEKEAENLLAEERKQRFEEAKEKLEQQAKNEQPVKNKQADTKGQPDTKGKPETKGQPVKNGQPVEVVKPGSGELVKNPVTPQSAADLKLEIEATSFLEEERRQRFENARKALEEQLGGSKSKNPPGKTPPTAQGGGEPVKPLEVPEPKEVIPPSGEIPSKPLAPHEVADKWEVPESVTEVKAKVKAQNQRIKDARKALEEKMGNSAAKNAEIVQQNKAEITEENPVKSGTRGDGQSGSSSPDAPSGAPNNGQPGSSSSGGKLPTVPNKGQPGPSPGEMPPDSRLPDSGSNVPDGSKGSAPKPHSDSSVPQPQAQDSHSVSKPNTHADPNPGGHPGSKPDITRVDSRLDSRPGSPSSDYTPGSSGGSSPDLSPNPPSSPVHGPSKVNADYKWDIEDALNVYKPETGPGSRPPGVSGPSGSNVKPEMTLENFDFGDDAMNEAWRGEMSYKDLPPMEPPSPGALPVEPLKVVDKVGPGGAPLLKTEPLAPNKGVGKLHHSWEAKSPAQANPAAGTAGTQAAQRVKHWEPVNTNGGLRHPISPGAVTDSQNGYNKMAVDQELKVKHDGKPVPGRNKLPDLAGGDIANLDGTFDPSKFDINHPPAEFAELGAEMTGAVEGEIDDIIRHSKAAEKSKWTKLKPKVATPETGMQKVMGAVSKGWDAIWDAIFAPFKFIWGMIKTLAAKIAKWFGHVSKGIGIWSKMARGFTRVFTAVKATRAWKIVAKAGSYYWTYVTKVAPQVLKHGVKWLGKAVSVAAWITLIFDVMDALQLADCMSRLNEQGDGPELPKYCQGEITKMLMSWMGHKMNQAAGKE